MTQENERSRTGSPGGQREMGGPTSTPASGSATSSNPSSDAQTGQPPSPRDPVTRPQAGRRTTDADRSAAITELLRGSSADAGDGDASTHDPAEPAQVGGVPQRDGAPPKVPKRLQEAADALGVTPEQIYDMEVTTGDGETVKLGALKDAWAGRQAAERETVQRSAKLDQRESALVQEQMLWGEMGDELNRSLTPAMRQKLQNRLAQREAQEREHLFRAMPDLADKAYFDTFRSDLTKALGDYGFAPHEIVLGDHRQILVVRDLMRAKERIKQLLSFAPTEKPAGSAAPQGRGSGSQAPQRQIGKSGGSADAIRGVSAILNKRRH